MLAIKKPYFGRIDYRETEDGDNYSLYIGKNGIRQNNITENLIVDWRTPVASVYYDSDIGMSSYMTPFSERINIDLKLKRTYEIEDSRLIDYYDSEVVTNDEFLTRYLSKNKEVVLGEIIATIQKEQNAIIRDNPWHSVIVQGVAGSGKTTVAMHRISYILYNYKEKFRPDEFYIIGSNKMLLNYITGVLPNLDVYNVNNMTMEEFLLLILDKDFDIKKGKYSLTNNFYKRLRAAESELMSRLQYFKGSMHFINALIIYLEKYEIACINTKDVEYDGQIIYSGEEILYLMNFFKELPFQEKIDMLNKRLTYKVKSINEEMMKRKDQVSAEVNKFKNYFGMSNQRLNLMDVYREFLTELMLHRDYYLDKNIEVPERDAIELL
jgi:DNA helicase-2/ATP-dependent DNA helicase PcrA